MTGHRGPGWLGKEEPPVWVGLVEPDNREETRLLKSVQGRGATVIRVRGDAQT